MKRSIPLLTVFVAAVSMLLAGCRHRVVVDADYPWPSSGVDVADSLLLQLCGSGGARMPLSEFEAAVDSFGRISDEHGSNRLIGARASYLRARYLFKTGRMHAAHDTVIAALSRLDSTRYAYDYFKLRSELERTAGEASQCFRLAVENVDFFRECGDSLSVAHSLLSLGFLYLRGGDSVCAHASFVDAGRIWRSKQMMVNYTKNLINEAFSSPRDSQLTIYHRLVCDPIIMADTTTYEIVLCNLSMIDPSDSVRIACNQRAIELLDGNPRYVNKMALHRGIQAWTLIDTDPDSALALVLAAYNNPAIEHSSVEGTYIAGALVKVWAALGRHDSALNYVDNVSSFKERENRHALAIAIESGRHSLAEANLQARLSREHRSRTMWVIIMAIALASMAAIFVFYRRYKARELSEKVTAAQLRESQSRLAREGVLFEEKERLLEQLRGDIEKAVALGDMSPKSGGRILSTIKIHASGREERQAFLDIHDHLLPGFSRRLKADFPAMTEGQVKLAAYIGAGMSNVSIAKLMNITAQSVRTSRYRLRSRFGLANGDSLEDFIRRYVDAD